MKFYINDLSLDGHFSDSQSFCSILEDLLKLRNRDPIFRDRLYCSRSLSSQKITSDANLRQAVLEKNDKNFTRLVLEWITRSGPFWDENRQYNPDDYFEYQSYDVTEQGLGEASRQKLAGNDASVFSFQGSILQFITSPLSVQQGLSEEPIDFVSVDNYWEFEQLIELIQNSKTYYCWKDVHVEIKRRFEGLIISDTAIAPLISTPFSKQVTKRIFELLYVLNQLVIESDINGQVSEIGMDLFNKHFMGDKAWFSDESVTNKRNFEQEMTFFDPEDKNKKILCSWHGKIKKPQIRIHFLWPRNPGGNKIKVVYIGPKITKG